MSLTKEEFYDFLKNFLYFQLGGEFTTIAEELEYEELNTMIDIKLYLENIQDSYSFSINKEHDSWELYKDNKVIYSLDNLYDRDYFLSEIYYNICTDNSLELTELYINVKSSYIVTPTLSHILLELKESVVLIDSVLIWVRDNDSKIKDDPIFNQIIDQLIKDQQMIIVDCHQLSLLPVNFKIVELEE